MDRNGPPPDGIAGDDPLAALRRAVNCDPALTRRLGAIVDPDAFCAALADVATAQGLGIGVPDLANLFRPDPLGLTRWAPAPLNPPGWPAAGWLPTRSLATGEGAAFDWAWFGDRPLDQPFYEDSVRQVGQFPLSQFLRPRTTLAALVAGCSAEADPVVPAGLVFHMSRCGSTLVARMLQSLPGCTAASEPEPLDAVIQWAWRAPVGQDQKIAALRAVAAALGRNRPTADSRFFIKLDCWHIFSLPLIRAAFPDTPWLFLTRDPLEVAVSQRAMAGVHVIPGMIGADMIGIEGGEAMAAEDYIARVLGRFCISAARHAGLGGGLFLDYRDLAPALSDAIPQHFGIPLDTAARAIIADLSGRDAKQPGQAFTGDSSHKRRSASAALVAAVDAFARPAYDHLRKSVAAAA